MDTVQPITPSSETSGIPQGIPTGVFVPNNQPPTVNMPVQAEIPVQQNMQQPMPVQNAQVPVMPVAAPMPAPEGPLDKVLKGLVRFFAKVMGQPDPITGIANPASQATQKTENLIGKMRGAANQAVAKASDVAGKAVNTATNVANQATQQVQQMVPPPAAAPMPPVAPVQQPPVMPTPPTA